MFGVFGSRGLDEATATRVRQVVDAGAKVVDVRTVEEYGQGHVDRAVNIPLHTLPVRMHEVGPKDRPVVVYCRSGGRSAQAADLLRRAGWSEVIDVGPMTAYPR
jgi:phage shock protein E